MAKVFEDVKLSWAGKGYTIPANRMLEAIARIEDHVTLVEITRHFQQRGSVPLARLALAFHAVLEFAGADARIRADDVYAGMFAGSDEQVAALGAVTTLLGMMVPAGAQKATALPGKRQPGGVPSSRKRTKR